MSRNTIGNKVCVGQGHAMTFRHPEAPTRSVQYHGQPSSLRRGPKTEGRGHGPVCASGRISEGELRRQRRLGLHASRVPNSAVFSRDFHHAGRPARPPTAVDQCRMPRRKHTITLSMSACKSLSSCRPPSLLQREPSTRDRVVPVEDA